MSQIGHGSRDFFSSKKAYLVEQWLLLVIIDGDLQNMFDKNFNFCRFFQLNGLM